MEEVWRDIQGYEGLYQVSNLGRVRSLDRWVDRTNQPGYFLQGKILKPRTGKNGYKYVVLCSRCEHRTFTIHRLVALAFVSNPNGFNVVNHIDGNKTNNAVDNIEWCSYSENTLHAIKEGLFKPEKSANTMRSQLRQNKNNTSGTKGVYFNKKLRKWQAYIRVNYKMIYLGVYENKEDAIKARLEKEREL